MDCTLLQRSRIYLSIEFWSVKSFQISPGVHTTRELLVVCLSICLFACLSVRTTKEEDEKNEKITALRTALWTVIGTKTHPILLLSMNNGLVNGYYLCKGIPHILLPYSAVESRRCCCSYRLQIDWLCTRRTRYQYFTYVLLYSLLASLASRGPLLDSYYS